MEIFSFGRAAGVADGDEGVEFLSARFFGIVRIGNCEYALCNCSFSLSGMILYLAEITFPFVIFLLETRGLVPQPRLCPGP